MLLTMSLSALQGACGAAGPDWAQVNLALVGQT